MMKLFNQVFDNIFIMFKRAAHAVYIHEISKPTKV